MNTPKSVGEATIGDVYRAYRQNSRVSLSDFVFQNFVVAWQPASMPFVNSHQALYPERHILSVQLLPKQNYPGLTLFERISQAQKHWALVYDPSMEDREITILMRLLYHEVSLTESLFGPEAVDSLRECGQPISADSEFGGRIANVLRRLEQSDFRIETTVRTAGSQIDSPALQRNPQAAFQYATDIFKGADLAAYLKRDGTLFIGTLETMLAGRTGHFQSGSFVVPPNEDSYANPPDLSPTNLFDVYQTVPVPEAPVNLRDRLALHDLAFEALRRMRKHPNPRHFIILGLS